MDKSFNIFCKYLKKKIIAMIIEVNTELNFSLKNFDYLLHKII